MTRGSRQRGRSPKGPGRTWAGAVTVLVATSSVAAGLIAGIFIVPSTPPAGLSSAAPLTTAAVVPQTFDDERTVAVKLSVSEPIPIVTNATGTVTGLRAAAGQAIASGTSPIDVDDAPLVALYTSVPLYRDLTSGDKGNDVTALQNELTRLGHPVTADGRYGRTTAAAMLSLKKQLGFADPDGDFSLAKTIWLPAPSVIPGKWAATLGATATAGGAIGTVPGALTAVTVASLPASLAAGPRMLTLWGASAPLGDHASATDPAFLAALSGTADFATVQAAPDDQDITAAITLSTPVDALKVPPAALFAVAGDHACLQSKGKPYAVTIAGSALGASLVTIDSGQAIESVDLGAAIEAKTCG